MKTQLQEDLNKNKIHHLADIRRVNHIDKLEKLGLPKNKYVIVSSGVMALYGIRENDDLDISVTPDLIYRILKMTKFNVKMYKAKEDHHIFPLFPICRLFDGKIEIGFRTFISSIHQLIRDATSYKGHLFLSFDHLINWKKDIGRKKDLDDIKLIERFCKKHKINIK